MSSGARAGGPLDLNRRVTIPIWRLGLGLGIAAAAGYADGRGYQSWLFWGLMFLASIICGTASPERAQP